MFNILIRTSGRPNFFKRCFESIEAQSYRNFRVLVSDDGDSKYAWMYPVEVFKVRKRDGHCFWNLYMNELLARVEKGWIIYLDDDVTMRPDALEIISKRCDSLKKVIVWKYQFQNGRVIPEKEFWGSPPTRKHWDSGCFSHHFKQKVLWQHARAADWRVGLQLYKKKLSFDWIDETLFFAGNNGDIGKKNDIILSR